MVVHRFFVTNMGGNPGNPHRVKAIAKRFVIKLATFRFGIAARGCHPIDGVKRSFSGPHGHGRVASQVRQT